ncbi:MAG: hypothetical protein IVW54_23140 [Candidatus Binataceae bacterium]|nr:hypothetical protein [Candidatus Binataceae bacterium]
MSTHRSIGTMGSKVWMTLFSMALLAMLPAAAGAVTLGDALNFAALSDTGDVIISNTARVSVNALGAAAGQNVTLGNTSLDSNDVIATSGVVTLGNYAKVKGECITNGGAVVLGTGAKCGSTDTSGTSPKLALVSQALTDVGTFESALASQTPTQTLGPISLAAGKKTTVFNTVAGLNIIQIDSITLGNSSILTVSGASSDFTVLNIVGDLSIGSGAHLALTGGIISSHVLINVQGTIPTWLNSTVIGATIVAPNSGVAAGSGARLDGAIIADGSITFGPNATLTFDPSLVDVPSGTPPPPLTLGRAAGFLLVSTGGTESVGNVLVADQGNFGGTTLAFGSNSKAAGDAIASANSGVAIKVGNYTTMSGALITGGGTISLGSGATAGSQDTSGGNAELATYAGAGPDSNSYAANLASETVNQVLPPINIAASHSQTITTALAGGLYVFQTASIKMGGSSTLTIDGVSGDFVVINVVGDINGPGVLNLSAGFKILLTGGLTADHVVFNVESSSVTPALIGGTSSVFNGTLVAAARAGTIGSGATINGQLIFGGAVTAGPNVTLNYVPVVPVP